MLWKMALSFAATAGLNRFPLEELQPRRTLETFDDRVSFVGPQPTVRVRCIGKLLIFRRERQVDLSLREKHDTANRGQGETARGYGSQTTDGGQTSRRRRIIASSRDRQSDVPRRVVVCWPRLEQIWPFLFTDSVPVR
jgi:hypothetical protein